MLAPNHPRHVIFTFIGDAKDYQDAVTFSEGGWGSLCHHDPEGTNCVRISAYVVVLIIVFPLKKIVERRHHIPGLALRLFGFTNDPGFIRFGRVTNFC